ncbi:MFS transporter protein [Rutstroemia sp. NJR-2017a BVV2]|nr:MFS transporter protein [Rutstroemia sp. NJR-2017a BVV2]
MDAQVTQAVGTEDDHGQSPNVSDESTLSKKVPLVESSQVPNEKSEVLVGSTDVVANFVEASDVGNAPTLASAAANHLEGKAFILFTTAFMLTMFLMSLDTTIISTAVPRISTEFQSIDDIGWYTSAYTLPFMALQPTFSKIYTYFNIKTVILGSLLGFELGSVICATAQSSAAFIVGRAISGCSAGALQSGGMAVIALSIPLHRVALFISTLTSMAAVAALTGPPLGGLFTDIPRLTWRFCFWINLQLSLPVLTDHAAVGAIALTLLFFGFPKPTQVPSKLNAKQMLKALDIPGTVLFVSSMISLFLALQWGGTRYLWSNPRVWGLLLASGLLFSSFLALQIYLGDRATIPPRIFRNRSLTLSLCASALLYLGTTVHVFYLPFYFQSAKGISASASGIRMIPYGVTFSMVQLAVGATVMATGVYLPFMWTGSALFAVGSGLLSTLKVNTDISRVIGFQILTAYGFGSSMQLCVIAARASVKDRKYLVVTSTLSIFAPNFGGSLAAAVAQNVFRRELVNHLQDSVVANRTGAIVAAGATGGSDVVSESFRGIVQEAFDSAVSRTFLIGVVAGGLAFLCTLGIKWNTIKKPSAAGGSS